METQAPTMSATKKRQPKAVLVEKKVHTALVKAQEKFLYQADLAEAIGIGRMALRGLLRNHRCAPKTLDRVIAFLAITKA